MLFLQTAIEALKSPCVEACELSSKASTKETLSRPLSFFFLSAQDSENVGSCGAGLSKFEKLFTDAHSILVSIDGIANYYCYFEPFISESPQSSSYQNKVLVTAKILV